MPFAKVGAMPQTATTSSSKSTNNGRGGSKQHRPKGITMEDLKKQTARRLAQEQNQVNGDVSIPGSHSVLPTATPLPLASLQHPQHHVPMTHRGQLYPLENDYQVDGGYNPYPRSSHHQQQLMAASPQPPSMRRGVDRMTVMPSPQHQYAPPPNLVQQHPGGYATSNYTNYPNAHENSQHGSSEYSQNYGVMTPTMPGSSMSVEQNQPSSTFGANAANNKLPHGLTVHELKEMTKARLQAEAAEKMEGDIQRDRGVSPLDFDVVSTGGASRDRAMSRDSTGRIGNSMYGMMGVPQAMDGFPRPAVQSPTLRQINRADTWDSASVASYNSNAYSENFGSETPLDVSYELTTSNRERSFTAPILPSAEGYANRNSWHNPASGQVARGAFANASFDAAVGGNRRRAVTMSPGANSIHEDRPHHGGWAGDRPHLPSFGSSIGTSGSVQARNRVYSPVLEQLGLDGPFARDQGLGLGDSAIGSNLFGSNASDFQSRGSSISESRIPAPPPGFLNSGGKDAASVNHDRLATFSPHESVEDNVFGGEKNPWGGDQRRRLATVENLATDLGSILNFSGSERQDRDRANTYTFGTDLPIQPSSNGSNGMDGINGLGGFRY